MNKLFGDFSEFLGLFIVFIFFLLQQMKKKPRRPAEEPSAVPLANALPTVPPREVKKPSLHALAAEKPVRAETPTPSPQEAKSVFVPPDAARLKGRRLILSYEAFSLPLSLRVPRI